MNQYIVLVTGPKDSLGFQFLQNVVELTSKGATLLEGKVPKMSFPHQCWMALSTDKFMKDSPGFQYQIVEEVFSKEQLDTMEWDQFRKTVKKAGIGGRTRDIMVRDYMKATGQVQTCQEV